MQHLVYNGKQSEAGSKIPLNAWPTQGGVCSKIQLGGGYDTMMSEATSGKASEWHSQAIFTNTTPWLLHLPIVIGPFVYKRAKEQTETAVHCLACTEIGDVQESQGVFIPQNVTLLTISLVSTF